MHLELKHTVRLGLAVAVGLFATAASASAQQPAPTPTPEPAPEVCEVVLETASVPVDAEPVIVKAAYSQELGETVTAEIAEESGIKVVSAETDAETPLTLKITLDTSAAAAGDWEFALRGDAGACAGTIAVAPVTPPPSR
jgi:hypothetical protein